MWLLLLLGLSAGCFGAAPWMMLQNEFLQLNVSYNSDHQTFWAISSLSLQHPALVSPVPSFLVNLRSVIPTTLTLKKETATLITSTELYAEFTLKRFFQIFPGHAFVKIYATFASNRRDFYISNCELLALQSPAPSGVKYFYIHQYSQESGAWENMLPVTSFINIGSTPVELKMGAHGAAYAPKVEQAWMAFDNQQVGWSIGLQFNGQMVTNTLVTDDSVFQLSTKIETINHTLADFEWPAAFVGLFDSNWNDPDWDEAGFLTQRFVEATQALPLPSDDYPYVQYDSWSWGVDVNETLLTQELSVAHKLGIEVFVIDLGWAINIGEWIPDPTKFPSGLKKLVDFAHSLGIKFGLHIPLPQVSPDSHIYKKHPDWVPYLANEYFGSTAQCLGHVPARTENIKALIALIDDYGVDYFVQDAENAVKRCTKASHTHNVMDSPYANSVDGLDYIWKAVREHKPDIILEHCADGGTMLTQKVPLIYDTSISVDNSDTLSTRLGQFGMSYAFSPRYSARYVQEVPTRYTLRSGMFGGPLVLQQQLQLYNQSTIQLTKSFIDEFKQFRKWIRDGKVYHLARPSQWNQGWDAIQSVAVNKQHSIAYVYRALGGDSTYVVKLKGLNPTARYSVTLLNDGSHLGTLPGKDIMDNGISVQLPELDSQGLLLRS